MANPKPTITFTVNLSNKENSSLPFNFDLEESQVNSRTTWLPSAGNPGEGETGLGVGGNIYTKNSDTVVAYGQEALYLKRTYASGKSDDLLTVVSIDW